MTVKELIRLLQNVDQYREVICQKDAEGNGYSPLYTITDDYNYVSDSSYSGGLDSEIVTGSVPALVLVPVN